MAGMSFLVFPFFLRIFLQTAGETQIRIGILSVLAWCMATGFIMFYLIKLVLGLRISREEELRRLDIDEHGTEACHGFQIFSSR